MLFWTTFEPRPSFCLHLQDLGVVFLQGLGRYKKEICCPYHALTLFLKYERIITANFANFAVAPGHLSCLLLTAHTHAGWASKKSNSSYQSRHFLQSAAFFKDHVWAMAGSKTRKSLVVDVETHFPMDEEAALFILVAVLLLQVPGLIVMKLLVTWHGGKLWRPGRKMRWETRPASLRQFLLLHLYIMSIFQDTCMALLTVCVTTSHWAHEFNWMENRISKCWVEIK